MSLVTDDSEDRYQIERKDRNSPYVLTIEDLINEDRGKYYCCLPTNCSNGTQGCQEWTLRVKGASCKHCQKSLHKYSLVTLIATRYLGERGGGRGGVEGGLGPKNHKLAASKVSIYMVDSGFR